MHCIVTVGDFTIKVTEVFTAHGMAPLHVLEVEEAGVAPRFPARAARITDLGESEVCEMVGNFLVKTDGPDADGPFFSHPELKQFLGE